jgi:hypothetical protein
MARVTTVALAMVLLLVGAAPGADEKEASKKKPVGTWKRTAGDNSITFTIKADTLHVVVKTGGDSKEIDADYGVSKDGVLFARINRTKNDGDGPSEGDLFSFRFTLDNDRLTLSELKTPQDSAQAKELVHGEYRKEKGAE